MCDLFSRKVLYNYFCFPLRPNSYTGFPECAAMVQTKTNLWILEKHDPNLRISEQGESEYGNRGMHAVSGLFQPYDGKYKCCSTNCQVHLGALRVESRILRFGSNNYDVTCYWATDFSNLFCGIHYRESNFEKSVTRNRQYNGNLGFLMVMLEKLFYVVDLGLGNQLFWVPRC